MLDPLEAALKGVIFLYGSSVSCCMGRLVLPWGKLIMFEYHAPFLEILCDLDRQYK